IFLAYIHMIIHIINLCTTYLQSELLQHRICDEHAHALCGQGGKILFQQHDISSMADELLSKDAARLSDDGIKVVKERVLQSAHGFLETTSTYDKVQAFKCPELAAELHRPLSCQARQWVSSNIVFVMTFCVLSAGLLKILWSIYQRRALSKRAEQIYEQVCEILEDNAVSAKAGNSECEPWVVTSWLRDHLLSTRERRNTLLWKKVEELLLEDSRIDQYPKVIKGEAKVVLEWQASGSLSGKIKKLQGAAGKTRSGSVGAIKLAEEICGS
uniref:Man1/Src1-like C-terminal domain-containing protein n=1 Tax=Aegilops tauschii subsp. strangulata TaxID=200361 RepID=A0A453JBF3_AEGTS